MAGDRARAEREAEAELPPDWPNRALIERAFTASLDRIRAAPETRLWGDRLMIPREGPRRIVGSVIFHGYPEDGVAEIAYGVDEGSQKNGFASEAVTASVAWALSEPGVHCVEATTPDWHHASIRVMQKAGLSFLEQREHELLGTLSVYAKRRGA